MKRVVRAALAGLVSLVVAGCGGGGGGGGGGGAGAAFPLVATPAAPQVNYVNGLSIRLNQPASVSSTVYEGQQIPSVLVSGTLSGDVSLLNGKVLVLLVVVPDPLFEEKPSVSINAAGLSASLLLTGKVAPDGAKVYKDNITVKACLDAACQSEIRVENPQVPYTVTVKAGLTLGQKSVDFVTPFGTYPAPVTVPVGLPADAASWSVAPVIGDTGGFKVEKAGDGSPNVVVSLEGLAPTGTTYKGSFSVRAITQDGQQLSRMLDVSLQTTASAAPYAPSRPEARFVVKQGYPYLTGMDAAVFFPGNTSDKMSYVSTTLSAPPGADTSMFPSGWLFFYSYDEAGLPRFATKSYSWKTQVQGCYNGQCLVPGRYTATLRFRYAPDGQPVSMFDFPVVMDIVP